MIKSNELESPYQGRWYGDVLPEVAYHLEAQAGAVDNAQKVGSLYTYTATFRDLEIREEFEVRWYIGHHRTFPFFKREFRVLADDCEDAGIKELKTGDSITIVQTPYSVPTAFDGRNFQAIAVVFKEEVVLYKSPGCNLDLYRATSINGLEPLPKDDTSRQLGTLMAKGIRRLLRI